MQMFHLVRGQLTRHSPDLRALFGRAAEIREAWDAEDLAGLNEAKREAEAKIAAARARQSPTLRAMQA